MADCEKCITNCSLRGQPSTKDCDRFTPNCAHDKQKDLTQGLGKTRHFYCPDCGYHQWNGRDWTKAQWENYTNKDLALQCEIEHLGHEFGEEPF